MLKGAIINEIRAKVPEQFRPKGTEGDRFSKSFMSAMGGIDADPAEQRYRDALDHHNLSILAVQNGQPNVRALTGTAAVMARNHQELVREEKTRKEREEEAMRSAYEAMRQNLQDAADYWRTKADEGEKKLGGLDGIAQKLGVERPKDMSEEEERRWYNDLILTKIANGEIDPNSDLAIYAQDRQHDYDAHARLDDWNRAAQQAEQTGDNSELDRMLEEERQKELMNRKYRDEISTGASVHVEEEIMERHKEGEVAADFSDDAIDEADMAMGFFEEEEFAASAVAMDVTGCFNTAVACIAPEPELATVENSVQVGVFKPAGMT